MTRLPSEFALVRGLGRGRVADMLLCRGTDGAEVVITPIEGAPEGGRTQDLDSELSAAAAAFDHPCAVPVSLIAEGDGLWLRQPYLKGGVGATPLPADVVVVGAVRLTAVLAQGHVAGMLHGDVCPANVVLDPSGSWCLAGAGVAHAVARLGTVCPPDPIFAAPEYFSGEQPGAAADVYSLGATLYAALTGAAPHADAAREGAGALYAARHGAAPELPSSVPAPLAALITRMLAADPAERPALTEVDQVLRGLAPTGAVLPPPIPVRQEPAPPRPAVRLVVTEPAVVAAASRRRTIVAAAAIAAVFLAGAGAVAATSGHDDGVELAAGSEPTASPTPTASASTPAPTKAAQKPAKVQQQKQVRAPANIGLPVELLIPNTLVLSVEFYKGEWVLLASFKMDAMVDSVRGWKMLATSSGNTIRNFYDASDEHVAGPHNFRFLSNVPLTSCVAVVTDIGQAATDDHLYKSETKCLTGDQVREMKAKGGSKLAAAPAATPGSQAAKP